MKAQARLEKMGVEIQLNAMVTDVDRNGITVKDADGTIRRIESACKVWSAGVSASPLGRDLAAPVGHRDRPGRPRQGQARSVDPRTPERLRRRRHGRSSRACPAWRRAPSRAASTSRRSSRTRSRPREHGNRPKPREPFQYFDKGSMATVSRFNAVAQIGKLEFGGFIAWLAWLGLHLVYLVGFKTKIATLLSWTVTFLGRAARTAHHHRAAGLRAHQDRGTRGDRRRRCRRRREPPASWPAARAGGRPATSPGCRRRRVSAACPVASKSPPGSAIR